MDNTAITIIIALVAAAVPAILSPIISFFTGYTTLRRLEAEVSVYNAIEQSMLVGQDDLVAHIILRHRVVADLKKVAYHGLPLIKNPNARAIMASVVSGCACLPMSLAGLPPYATIPISVAIGFAAGAVYEKAQIAKLKKLVQYEKYERIYEELCEKYGFDLSDEDARSRASADEKGIDHKDPEK